MTTELRKSVRRKTAGRYRGRRIIVRLIPGDVIGFREERLRTEYTLSIAGAFHYAVQLEVERRKEERSRKRKAKR